MPTQSKAGLFVRIRAQLLLRSARIHRHYGIVHADKAEFLSAVEHYGKAIKLNPGLGAAYLERGILEWRELGRATHAVRDLTAALALRPNWPDALFNRAMAYQATGDYQSAMTDLAAYLDQGDDTWRHDAANQLRQIRSLYPPSPTPESGENVA
jgi:tetratricopeptide (TPR) repeat protein